MKETQLDALLQAAKDVVIQRGKDYAPGVAITSAIAMDNLRAAIAAAEGQSRDTSAREGE